MLLICLFTGLFQRGIEFRSINIYVSQNKVDSF
jgi:hypothetical protein